MWTSILNILGSGVFGSLVGLLGNWLNQSQIRKTKEMENNHEIAMAKVRIEVLNAETNASIKINEAKVQGAVDLQDSKAYAKTIVIANEKSFSDKWIDKMLDVTGWFRYITIPLAFMIMGPLAFVDVLKGFMRPTLTIAFTTGFGYLTWASYSILKTKGIATLTPDQAATYFMLAIDTCVMLTTTCVTWWFGDRRVAKAIARMTEKRLSMNDKLNKTTADNIEKIAF
ncbi:MAG: hypothetical protein PVG39_02440 [Desulfobacteraceae bacterium]|jgi:hypothetical protein